MGMVMAITVSGEGEWSVKTARSFASPSPRVVYVMTLMQNLGQSKMHLPQGCEDHTGHQKGGPDGLGVWSAWAADPCWLSNRGVFLQVNFWPIHRDMTPPRRLPRA